MQLRKILDFFIFSKLFVAIAVTSLSASCSVVLEQAFDNTVLGFTFFATLSLYAFHQFWGLRFVDHNNLIGRRRWVVRNKRLLIFLSAISSLIAGYFAMILSLEILILLLPVAVVSVGYSLPIFFGKRLRDFPAIKIYLIALVVACVVVVLPTMGKEVLFEELAVLLLVQVMFILGITIPFDIRDIQVDTHDLKTIPILLGVRNSKILAMLLLFVSSITSVMFLGNGIGIAVSGVLALIPVWYSSPIRGDYYFPLLLEGMMVLQFLFVLICS